MIRGSVWVVSDLEHVCSRCRRELAPKTCHGYDQTSRVRLCGSCVVSTLCELTEYSCEPTQKH